MILEGLHEKRLFTDYIPFNIVQNADQNFEYPFHWHSATELIYITDGEGTFQVNNIEYQLSKRDILFVAAGDIHNFKINNSFGIRYFLHFDFAKLNGFVSINTYSSLLVRTKKFSAQDDQDLHQELEKHIIEIINVFEKKDFAYELLLNARILDITFILSRSSSYSQDEKNDVNKVKELEKLDLAFKFIEENYQSDISLKDVAKAASFSPYYFSRIFKEAAEMSFHDYLNVYRIKKVERCLSEFNMTIAMAAHASGFNSIATFNRIFKRIKGCSPSDHLKKQNKQQTMGE